MKQLYIFSYFMMWNIQLYILKNSQWDNYHTLCDQYLIVYHRLHITTFLHINTFLHTPGTPNPLFPENEYLWWRKRRVKRLGQSSELRKMIPPTTSSIVLTLVIESLSKIVKGRIISQTLAFEIFLFQVQLLAN